MKSDINHFLTTSSKKFKNLITMALTTADGFPIHADINLPNNEKEKIAAISSSLLSLSNAASRQLLDSNLKNTTIETEKGNVFLSNTAYEGKKCVLCVITGPNENIGHARYFTQLIAQELKEQ